MADDPPKIPAMGEGPTRIPGPAGSRWHDSGDEPRRDRGALRRDGDKPPRDDEDSRADQESQQDGATAAGPVHTEDAHRDSLRPDPTAPPEARTTIPADLQGDEDARS